MDDSGLRLRDLAEGALEARALRGSEAAWNELVRRHERRVVLALLASGVVLDVAEEAAQEAWLKLVQKQRAGSLTTLQLPGLAIAQARWIARETLRTRARREAIAASGGVTLDDVAEAVAAPAASIEEAMIHRERVDAIRAELRALPARARAIFVAVYGVPGTSHAEVARIQGISLQRVRQTLCEVRDRMRRMLAARDRAEER